MLEKGERGRLTMEPHTLPIHCSADERWLTGGCSVLSRMANQTVCQCFHLTSFALLMSPRGPRVGRHTGSAS